MIELPESYVLAEQINRTIKGKTIANVEANHTPHAFAWYTGNPATGMNISAERCKRYRENISQIVQGEMLNVQT